MNNPQIENKTHPLKVFLIELFSVRAGLHIKQEHDSKRGHKRA